MLLWITLKPPSSTWLAGKGCFTRRWPGNWRSCGAFVGGLFGNWFGNGFGGNGWGGRGGYPAEAAVVAQGAADTVILDNLNSLQSSINGLGLSIVQGQGAANVVAAQGFGGLNTTVLQGDAALTAAITNGNAGIQSTLCQGFSGVNQSVYQADVDKTGIKW